MKQKKEDILIGALESAELLQDGTDEIEALEGLNKTVGALKAFSFNSKLNELLALKLLFKIKTRKLYKKIGTWEVFLNRYGMNRRTIDDKLLDMKKLGEQAYCALIELDFREADLRLLKNNERVAIEAPKEEGQPPVITVDGQAVIVNEENSEQLKEIISDLAIEKEKAKTKLKELKAADREKDKYIDALEKKVDELVSPVTKSVRGLQDEIAGLQNTMLGLHRKCQSLLNTYKDQPEHETVVIAAIAWFVRFSEEFAGLTGDAMEGEDFYDTSYLNPENLEVEKE